MKSLFFGEVSDKIWESLNFLGDKETISVYFPIWVQSRELDLRISEQSRPGFSSGTTHRFLNIGGIHCQV